MSAPDRSGLVMQICNAHPEVFNVPPEQNDPSRLAFLKSTLLPALIALDGQWGYLVKTDQGNKVPVDIIVWKDTREHFDIMTGTGGAWQPRGVLTNPNWIWSQEGIQSTPITDPIPNPVPPGNDEILQALVELNAKLEILSSDVHALMDAQNVMMQAITSVVQQNTTIAKALTTLMAKPAPIYDIKVFGATVVAKPRTGE